MADSRLPHSRNCRHFNPGISSQDCLHSINKAAVCSPFHCRYLPAPDHLDARQAHSFYQLPSEHVLPDVTEIESPWQVSLASGSGARRLAESRCRASVQLLLVQVHPPVLCSDALKQKC